MLPKDLTDSVWQNPFQSQEDRDYWLLKTLDTSHDGAIELVLDIIHADQRGAIGCNRDGTLWHVQNKIRNN